MKLNAARKALVAVCLFGMTSLVVAADFVDAYEAASAEEYNKAARIWHELALKGNRDAQFNLALIYHSGVAGPQDEKEAVKWYQQAASNGHVQAQEYMAVGYREGWFGLDRDVSKAEFWEAKLDQ